MPQEISPTPINQEALSLARASLPTDELLTVVVQTFGALADPTRARILFALRSGELCVRDLALAVGVSESAISHQLRLLRDRRLVRSRRDGTTIYYTVDGHHLAVLLREADYHAEHLQHDSPEHHHS